MDFDQMWNDPYMANTLIVQMASSVAYLGYTG